MQKVTGCEPILMGLSLRPNKRSLEPKAPKADVAATVTLLVGGVSRTLVNAVVMNRSSVRCILDVEKLLLHCSKLE
jgi:hypothetical protein